MHVCVGERERGHAGVMTVLHSNTQEAYLIESHLSRFKEPQLSGQLIQPSSEQKWPPVLKSMHILTCVDSAKKVTEAAVNLNLYLIY